MSTNAYIIKPIDGGMYEGIYNHWDGYPSNMLPLLNDNYIGKIDELLDLGDISSLAPTLQDTIFYKRDRGEDDTDKSIYEKHHLKELVQYGGYIYLYKDGKYKNVSLDEL